MSAADDRRERWAWFVAEVGRVVEELGGGTARDVREHLAVRLGAAEVGAFDVRAFGVALRELQAAGRVVIHAPEELPPSARRPLFRAPHVWRPSGSRRARGGLV